MRRKLFVSLIATFLMPAALQAQGILFWKPENRLKNYQKHGRWNTYHDNEKKVVQSKGRYRNGNPVGVWKYYDEHGNIEQHDKHWPDKIITKKFHSNGKVRLKGTGLIEIDSTHAEYFYQGIWKFYSETGQLVKAVRYERGEDVEEIVYLKPAEE